LAHKKERFMQKRSILVGLLLIAALLLAACPAPAPATGDTAADTPVPATEATTAPAAESPAAESPAPAAGGQVVIAPGETIRIGNSVALTGPIPDPGLDIRQAAELAVDDLNAAGGLEGFLYELVVEDGACSGDQGTVVANKFAADESIVAVSGGTCSGETFSLVPILSEARIPFVSPSATNPDITSEECDICNRVALSDALQGEVDANFVRTDLGLDRVAVIHDNSDYGRGLAEVFQTAFEALGGEVTDFEGVQVGDTDFRAALARIGANSPQLIFFGGYSTEAGLIAQQMQETPGLEETLFLSDDGAYTQQYLDTAGSAAEGTYASFVAGATDPESLEEFTQKYIDKYGVSPSDLGPFHGQSYDSVRLIADAIARVATVDDSGNLVIDREELITAIRATEGFEGLTGTLSCNEIGECGAGGIQIFQAQDGAWVQVSGYGLE
jgi:branched-chain amino acid transport system substrate-binding protein